jgi:hypothetical protein
VTVEKTTGAAITTRTLPPTHIASENRITWDTTLDIPVTYQVRRDTIVSRTMTVSPRPADLSDRVWRYTLAAIVAAGFAIRLHALASRSY